MGLKPSKNKRKKNKHSNPQKRDLISANEKKRINSRKRELLPAKNEDPQFFNGIVKLKEQKGSIIYPKITVFESETPRRESGQTGVQIFMILKSGDWLGMPRSALLPF